MSAKTPTETDPAEPAPAPESEQASESVPASEPTSAAAVAAAIENSTTAGIPSTVPVSEANAVQAIPKAETATAPSSVAATSVGAGSAVDFDSIRIVPEVVRVKPPHTLTVQFADKTVTLPAHITRAQSAVFPVITLPPLPSGAVYFTLIKLDPDAPSRSNHWFRSFLHYLHVNINDTTQPLTDKTGAVVAPWYPAAPPPFTGPHRYVFLLYAHQKLLSVPNKYPAPLPMTKRGSFKPETLLSWFDDDDKPILYSGNYYIAENATQKLFGNTGEITKEIR